MREGTVAIAEASRLAADGRLTRGVIAAVRILFGVLWITQAAWKQPPFDTLRYYTEFGSSAPVLAPYGWLVDHVILPNFTFFAWVTTITEAAIGGFLLIGLLTRFWLLVAIAQSVAITLSVINAPHEWSWAYYMMIAGQAALFAVAAGRSFGLDGVLRPAWVARDGRLGTWLGRAS